MHYIQSLVHTYRPSIIPLSLSHTSNLNLSALQILSQTLHTGIKNKLSKTWEHVWMSVQKAVHEFQGKSNDSQTPFWKRKESGCFSKTSFCPQKSVCNNKTNMHYTECHEILFHARNVMKTDENTLLCCFMRMNKFSSIQILQTISRIWPKPQTLK